MDSTYFGKSFKSTSTIDRDCKCYGLGKIKKLLEQNNFKMLLMDLELRLFRNDGAM